MPATNATPNFIGLKTPPVSPFVNLPDLMKQILYHEENSDINAAIEQDCGLTDEQGDAMMKVIRKVILQTIKPSELVATIMKDLSLDQTKATTLAVNLLARRFLVMEWYLGPIQPLLHQMGVDPAPYVEMAKKLYPEVYTPLVTPTEPEPDPLIYEPADGPTPPPSAPNAPASTGASTLTPFSDLERYLPTIEKHLSSFDGQAEILLRLTTLGDEVEEAVKAGRVDQAEGERMIADLDAVSGMINTRDLNPFEVQAIRRRLTRLIEGLKGKVA